ncbi:MAG: mechanosensitive ion channel family protein [Myxococcota bacterium]|nr:mechanosensitive ion channel family protein [Myxococcota bacterium]
MLVLPARPSRLAAPRAFVPWRAVAALPLLLPAAARAAEPAVEEGPPAPPDVLEGLLPEVLVEATVLDLALWQWAGLLAAVVVAAALSWVLAIAILAVVRRVVARTESDLDDRLLGAAIGPVRLLAGVVVYRSAMAPLRLGPAASDFLETLLRALFVIALTWLLMRVVDVLSALVEERLVDRGQQAATGLVAPGRKVVKLLVIALALVAILDAFGFNVAALIAGLGVGGIAVALAAQKTLENLFGGATLYTDRPVQVGDFCRFGDQVGTVEEIGIRSTRVRTLGRTLVSVPNSEFSSMQLENFAARDRILIHTTIGVRYETTPEQLRYILVEIRELLYSHARVTAEPARIRFVGFGAYSLDLEIFAYVDTSDWNEFLGIREDLFLRIMDIVEDAGSGFAFPSSTVYLGKDEAPSAERAKEVAEQVEAWREAEQVYLPDFPPERIEEIAGSVGYPPPGAPGSRQRPD